MGDHERLEHFYKKFEQNNKFHCYENKNIEACHSLGDYYAKINKSQDALRAFEVNCFENQFGASCLEYARLKHNGKNGPSDPERFFKAVEMGCTGARPDLRCCGIYGKILEAPEGSNLIRGMNRKKQDVKKALELYDKGCAAYEGESCLLAARYHLRNKDIAKGLAYAELACDNCSNIHGCKIAAGIHFNGDKEHNIPVNMDKYLQYRNRVTKLVPAKPLESLYSKD